MMNDIRDVKASNKPEDNEPPEHSVPLRIVVFLMALICVAASCFFVRTDIIMTLVYVFLIFAGSFLSYVYREDEPKWLRYTWIVGIFAVGANALREFTGPLRDDFDFVSPFVHFLAGVFVFVTFSMRRRSDLNVSSGLGLILLCMISPVAKGIDYGICVASYLTLGTVMLYFDCVSRTMTSWVSKPMMQAPEVNLRNVSKRSRRLAQGNTIALIVALPVAAMLLFMFLPRADELLDRLWAATRSFDLNLKMANSSTQQLPEEARERNNRAWFEKHNESMKELNKERLKKNKGVEKQAASKDKKKVEMPAPNLPALNKDAELEKKAREESRKAAKKDKKEPEKQTPPALKDADKHKEKGKKDKASDEEKKAKDEPESPKGKRDKKPENQPPKAPEKKGEEKRAEDKKEEPKPKQDKKGPEASKAGKPESGKTEKAAEARRGKRAGKGAGSVAGDAAPGSKKGAGKHGTGGGDNKKKAPSADGSEKHSLRPKRTTSANKLDMGGNEKILSLTSIPEAPSDAVIMLVKSRRLVFLRRNCYDVYTGKEWKRSGDAKDKDKPKSTSVKVVDGLIQRELIVAPEPQAVPTQTQSGDRQRAYQQAYPQYGGDPNNRRVTAAPVNILAGGSGTPPQAVNTLPVGAGVNPTPAASKVESTASTAQPEKGDFRGRERVFEFISKERPKFLVNMADAFSVPPNFPSVDLVEEIVVKAKTIGKLVPAAWIPQEIGLDRNHEQLKVDELGVISVKKPLVLDSVFKVKTTLPMFPLNSMRQAGLKSAAEEEQIRNTFKTFLQLPPTIDDEVFTLAEQQADPRYNWYVQCEQLAAFLRLNYKYDFDREVADGVEDCVKELLFVRKTGFSSDYASAFVVMARCLGIPARVVSGFSPGKLNKVTGNQEITPTDGHQWAEAYIPDYGWVPFDATPDGFLPAQKRENQYTFTEVKKQLGIEKDKEEAEREAIKILDVIVGILASLVVLVVAFFVGRALFKTIKRYIANRTGRGPEWAIYKKVSKRLKKRLKVKREPHETSAQFVDRVRSTVDEQRAQGKGVSDGIPAALDAFMTTYNQVYFGKRADELENLKYHADQLNKQIGTSTKTEAAAATGGRPPSGPSAGPSSQDHDAVRPTRRG